MNLLALDRVCLAYGHHPLLDHVNFTIRAGERVCLIGRNGTGKSTLFRVIAGQAEPDDGEVWRRDTLRIAMLEQDVPADSPQTIFETVAGGLGELGQLLADYHSAVHDGHDERGHRGHMDELARLQARIEVLDGWNINRKVETAISRLSLDPDKRLRDCSGGMRRRVLLARALVSEPELLLLDEPTNHMDIAAIRWLEEFLLNFKGALIFITHDRTLLRHLATRIIELDRGQLSSFEGDYDYYERKKEEMLNAEARANARFDKKLAEHETWIRQGIKARRTRNEGRVRKLLAMRQQRSQRLELAGKASFAVDSGEAAGKIVADLRHVNFSYGGHRIIHDLSTRIMRGDRIGIIGANGSGKSTLLKILLGELKPDSGQVVLGQRLEIAYFDQHRELLEVNKTVRENLSQGSDYVSVKGKSRHVISYLKDFLFPPERVDSPVKALSGGERNRLLLARLFTRPANMLVLDEPTNDLDVETLELLEELLSEYDGTLLLVSHDRTFLDNVVTSTLVFEDDGELREYVGGYEDWLSQRRSRQATTTVKTSGADDVPPRTAPGTGGDKPRNGKTKLSYKDQRELDALPARIEELEQEQEILQQQINHADFYQQDKDSVASVMARLKETDEALHQAYQRWEQLESGPT